MSVRCNRYALLAVMFTVVIGVPASARADAIFYGPTPYLQSSDSPFSSVGSSYFYLETFEDGLVNTLGLTVSGGIAIMGEYVDSVDGDDGVIDGNGSATGHSLWSNFTETVLTFNFDVDLLGALPTYAGLVWTDFGYNSPTPYYGPVTLEAFGGSGQSLGSTGPFILGDGMDMGQTAEDRFFGVFDPLGISSIRMTTNTTDWEVDHVQYGRQITTVPEPSTLLLMGLAIVGLSGRRLRRS